MYVGVGGYMVKRSHKSAATPVADKTAPQIFTYLCSALAYSEVGRSSRSGAQSLFNSAVTTYVYLFNDQKRRWVGRLLFAQRGTQVAD